MIAPAPSKTAAAGLAAAVVLTAAGWLAQRYCDPTPPADRSSRVVMVGVRGLSWQTLIDLDERGRLPAFRSLIEGRSAGADIVAPGYGNPGEVLASVITGKFTNKHGVRGFAEAGRFRERGNPYRAPLWELLADRGHAVGVVGFPFWAPIDRAGSWVVPDWPTFSRDHVVYHEGSGVELPARWGGAIVTPDAVPERLVRRVTRGRELPAELLSELRSSLAADLTLTALAEEIFNESPEIHVFVYEQGLARWEERLDRVDPGLAEPLVAGYHEVVDGLLHRLRTWDDGATTFLVFSEQGNRGDGITYRRGFPELSRWPPVGWLLAWGRGIQRGVDPWIVAPVDLAVTLLYVSGNPVPNDMDGVILFGLLHDDYYHEHRATFSR